MKTKTLSVPGDKSISHRAIIFSALSNQTVIIQNLLEGEDVLRTIDIFRKLGVVIRKKGSLWVLKGRRPIDLHPYKGVLYCGNSGTTMRLMMGVLAALPFQSELTGDRSLNRRPMERVARPLRQMGAKIEEVSLYGKRIIRVKGPVVRGIDYRSPIASAQLKSALLLAGRHAGLPVKIREPIRSRDHTERMIRLFRKPVSRLVVPGDPSSAAFFVVAGLIHPDRKIILKNVGLNPTRTGFLKILKKMGGRIQIQKKRDLFGEPIGDLVVRPSALRATRVGGGIVPSLIDEVPILAVAAVFAKGTSRFANLGELRVKESDRISVLVKELRRFGVKIREQRDGFVIVGGGPFRPAIASSHGDHRIAMALTVLASAITGSSQVRGSACIQTSYPSFKSDLKKLGPYFSNLLKK